MLYICFIPKHFIAVSPSYQFSTVSSESREAALRRLARLVLLEVYIAPELAEQREQDVQALHHRLVVGKLVAGDVHHRANQARIVCGVHIDLGPWEGDVLEGLLHILGPFLHQVVDVRHLFSVVDRGGGTGLVEVLHAVDPPRDLLGLLISVLDGFDIHRGSAHDVSLLDVSQLNNCLIFWVQGGLIEHSDTQVFLGAVRLWHLEEGVHFTN